MLVNASDVMAKEEGRSSTAALKDVPFRAHVELLRNFVSRRAEIVGRIEDALNAQRKPPELLHDRGYLARELDDCFFRGLTLEQSLLRGELQDAHWRRGFEPREAPGMSNDLIDAAELMRRGFHLWASTRWPGRNGRARWAQTLFNLYVLRQVALLVMRVWDEGRDQAGERLARVQAVLAELWKGSPADQPVLVRDARSLIPIALSPATDELAPYFDVAQDVAASFSDDDRVEILNAVVRMGGGHLRSYLHYYVTQKGKVLEDPDFVLLVRKSEALDFSLLIHGLVPLLEAYERAVQNGDAAKRTVLADSICQGISPDPELFVNRADLLGGYSMVEYLFTVADNEGSVAYTPLGQRHVELLDEYAHRIARVTPPLFEDCQKLRPEEGGYSPYGALYGFASNLLEHMALKLLDRDADTRFAVEDVFTAGGADKRAWSNGLRRLPHVSAEVASLYAYPQAFAQRMFARVDEALRIGASAAAAPRTGRLLVVAEDGAGSGVPNGTPDPAAVPDLPPYYVLSSDDDLVAAGRSRAYDEAQLLSERQEGHFLVSYATPKGWAAISKDVLTDVLGAGRDAKIAGLPSTAAATLRLMGRGLVGS